MEILTIPQGETELVCDCYVGEPIRHVVTANDLQYNPGLSEVGVKEGDTVSLRPDDAPADNGGHVLSRAGNGDIICTCTKCGRFRKYPSV